MNQQRNPAGGTDWQPATLYTLGFLTLIATFNYLDRSILGLALPAIKQEMRATDTELGLVSGLAFVLFYSLLGIPIAWAADRTNRRTLIAAGFAFWSAMTILSGFVANVWQLAAARFLMGAGEATGLAPSASMISDLFRPARRPLAMSIFGTAGVVSGVAFFPLVGAIGQQHGWRAMFVAAGLPGVALALLFALTVREPPRGATDGEAAARSSPGLRETAVFLLGSRAYLLLTAGATFMGASLFAEAAWLPTFLARVHGMTLAETAFAIGPVRGGLGAIGIVALGLLIDRLGRRRPTIRARIPAVACLVAGPAEALLLLADASPLWTAGFALSGFFILAYQGPVFALGMSVVRPPMRAVATAVMVVSAALLGQVAGPLIVGMLNDLLAPQVGPVAIRYSMLLGAATPILAGVLIWRAGAWIEADAARAARPGQGLS